jgi:hypothetical protein
VKAALNRPALGAFPPVGWAELLETGLMKAAPKGMDQCTTTLCGSSANGKLMDHLVYCIRHELTSRKRIQASIHGIQTA